MKRTMNPTINGVKENRRKNKKKKKHVKTGNKPFFEDGKEYVSSFHATTKDTSTLNINESTDNMIEKTVSGKHIDMIEAKKKNRLKKKERMTEDNSRKTHKKHTCSCTEEVNCHACMYKDKARTSRMFKGGELLSWHSETRSHSCDKLSCKSNACSRCMESESKSNLDPDCVPPEESNGVIGGYKVSKTEKKRDNIGKRIGSPNVLLPNSTEMDVILLDSSDSENETSKNCSIYHVNDVHNTSEKFQSDEAQYDWFSPLHRISGGRSRETLEMLKGKGIVPRRGKWAPDEVKKLEANMKEFLATHDVKDYVGLIEITTREDLMFRRKTQFLLKMCRGIQRTSRDIGCKIYRHFCDFYRKGVLSREEVQELIKLRLQGVRWKAIGIQMQRISNGLHVIHNRLAGNWNRGPWSAQEDKALIEFVKGCADRGEKVSWRLASKAVGKRYDWSCQRRWYILSKRSEDVTQNEIYQLVSLIHESNVDDEYFIDWNDLSRHFNHKFSPSCLRSKFGVICKEVPNSHKLEFGELVEQLYEIYRIKIDNKNIDKNEKVMLTDEGIFTDDIQNELSSENISQNEATYLYDVIVVD